MNAVIMDSEASSSTSSSQPISLFPAYSSGTHNQTAKPDWLCNSSFTESAFKEASSVLLNQQNERAASETSSAVPAEIKTARKHGTECKKKSYKKTKYKKYSDTSLSVPESESIISQLKKKTFIEETGLSFERAFQTDATRDPENLMFESFERTKIASYKTRLDAPVGLSPKENLLWSLSLPKKTEKVPVRYFDKSSLKIMKNLTSYIVSVRKEPLEMSNFGDYLPITASPNYLDKNPEMTPDFLNISSSWKMEKKKDDKSTMEDKSSEYLNNELRNEIVRYNKMLTEHPNDVESWIDFVDFQDKILATVNTDKNSLYSEKSIIEKKIAILEKALKYNPKDVKLNVLKLKLSQNLYSSDQLTSLWENLVFFNPNNAEVWREFVLFSVTNLTTFNVSAILKLYQKCLRTLSNVYEGKTESHKPSKDIVLNMIGIFDQLCFVLRSCGCTEKAIAAYQALIEFNLFCDPSVERLPVDEKIVSLEPFWDSGAPRVGEKDALGWRTTVELKKIVFNQISTDSDLNNAEDKILSEKFDLEATWLQFERLRERHHWLPWRPNPEYDQTSDDIDDLDRTVLFDDISKFLFSIHNDEHKFILLLHFVTHLGFDPHALGCSILQNGTSNPFRLEQYEKITIHLRRSRLIHSLADPFPSNAVWNEDKIDFVNNVFSQASNSFSGRYRTLCTLLWVKFRHHCILESSDDKSNKKNLVDLKKFVKAMLKKSENRNCLYLWYEYIYIESLTDELSAKRTFEALLLSSTAAVSAGNMRVDELWYFVQAFIQLHLDSNKTISENEIIWILIHVANKETYTNFSSQGIMPTMLLKTTSVFKSDLEKELSCIDSLSISLCCCLDPVLYTLLNCANCFAYFQYFTQGCDAAMQVYENLNSSVVSRTKSDCARYLSEQITVAQARLLDFHTWNSTASMKPLQTFLSSSVKEYPHNSQILYLLVKLRSASSVINPTRRLLTEILRKRHKSHSVTWFYTLIAEFAVCCSLLQSYTDEGLPKESVSDLGINWRIRSLFEKMLEGDICSHISVLWRSYLKFEIMSRNVEKAKSVYHRALQYCGWSKELLMDAIKYFPDQLNEILAFMTEKQIRIHTPLEEVKLLMEHAVH